MMHVWAGLSIAAGAVATLLMLVLLMAGCANSTPAKLRLMKQLMLATALAGLAGATMGIAVWTRGRPDAACLWGLAPAAFVVALIIIMLKLRI